MTDALAGHADDLVEQLTVATSGKYQFSGGGAGDDARFARTHVFHGTKAFTNAVVALELLSANPLGMVGRMLKGAHFVGCNTYGQIARADGQFGGFHNCTAVVMVLPA